MQVPLVSRLSDSFLLKAKTGSDCLTKMKFQLSGKDEASLWEYKLTPALLHKGHPTPAQERNVIMTQ
jgi:hypothetical protein